MRVSIFKVWRLL